MAIKVEFYAENQITASSIVEFALSAGAVLQSYAEVEPPLKRPKSKRNGHGGARSRASSYKLVMSDNSFTKGSQRYKALEHLLRHGTEGQVFPRSELIAFLVKKTRLEAASVRACIKAMVEHGNLEAVYNG